MRLLTNYAFDSQNRLCLVFTGQTELRRRLAMTVHEALNQRVVVRFHLGPLAHDELAAYLGHHPFWLRRDLVAGGDVWRLHDGDRLPANQRTVALLCPRHERRRGAEPAEYVVLR